MSSPLSSRAHRSSSAAVNSFSAKAIGHIAPSSRFASWLKQIDICMSIELCLLFRFPVRCGPGLLLCWIGGLQALLSGALVGLNLRVVRGKSLAFEKLCLTRTERLALMVRGRLLHRAHAKVSSFQLQADYSPTRIREQRIATGIIQSPTPPSDTRPLSAW